MSSSPPTTEDRDIPSSTPSQPNFPRQALSTALTSSAQLANLLPTGTLLAFQLLTPIFTRNGACDRVTGPLTGILLVALAASCFLASFTDSLRTTDGKLYYGFVTPRGMWLLDFDYVSSDVSKLPDLAKYRLRLVDFVHAVMSVLVFVSVALRDRNVVRCFYPSPGPEAEEVLDIVPIGVGVLAGLLFIVVPTRRHGIGFPVSSGDGVYGKSD